MIKFVLSFLKEVSGLFLLLLCLLMRSLFTLFKSPSNYTWPDNDPLSYPYFCNDYLPWARWCFSEVELRPNGYFYFLIQELIWIALAIYIRIFTPKFKFAHSVFIGITVVSLFDYIIAYQTTWIFIGSLPFNWNILQVVLFTLAIFEEIILLIERQRQSLH